jgi:hypothetical protein
MKVAMLALIGLILGAVIGCVIGCVIGVCRGLISTEVFQTSSFEGYSGMLKFFTFMPIGIIVGGLIGAIGLGYVASRNHA